MVAGLTAAVVLLLVFGIAGLALSRGEIAIQRNEAETQRAKLSRA